MNSLILSFMKLSRFCGLLLLVLCWSTSAQAWWNPEWAIRKQITVDTASKKAALPGAVGSPVVLVRLHDGNFQFANAAEDGSDIRFVGADDKTPLSFHIEKFDSLLSEAFIWVRLPEIAAGETTSIWLYYGNSKGAAERAVDQKATYNGKLDLVYHFGEQGAAPTDASGNENHAEKAGIGSSGAMIGGGIRFAGAPLTIPSSKTLEWRAGGSLSWSTWIKPADQLPNTVLFGRKEGANSFAIGLDSGAPYVEVTNSGVAQRSKGSSPIATNAWHHLAVVSENGKFSIFVNGEASGTLEAALPELKAALQLGGGAPEEIGVTAFTGEMDELQISREVLTPAAIKFAALTQGGDKAAWLIAMGDEEAPKGMFDFMNGGFMEIIVGSLTVDGWICIAILAVMFAISWWVMIGKSSYLNRIAKGNVAFVEEWQHLAGNFGLISNGDEDQAQRLGGRVSADKAKAMQHSSAYRLYQIGSREVRSRMMAEGSSQKTLSARSLSAIRASLDSGFLHEMKRINSNMVLLTIAISGGPFLGLLGTVIGVMITFAAVAEAGDVNVNAIAPGIAAALLATVAGLAVAIPALFGYNYLLARVKEASMAMQIFIEEFTTRAGEFYDNAR